ncbi:hypothetical protein DFR41_10770 [Pseudacidovorax intermedius]|uniref:Uncharacterized protein n=1 Tax=Pseudacidovorax intermedius TaxID=433924 RepID=A0A370FE57_9BURK|nr:hypothetical protein DFR41_10770 [Pseudacidovorax intermedius]
MAKPAQSFAGSSNSCCAAWIDAAEGRDRRAAARSGDMGRGLAAARGGPGACRTGATAAAGRRGVVAGTDAGIPGEAVGSWAALMATTASRPSAARSTTSSTWTASIFHSVVSAPPARYNCQPAGPTAMSARLRVASACITVPPSCTEGASSDQAACAPATRSIAPAIRTRRERRTNGGPTARMKVMDSNSTSAGAPAQNVIVPTVQPLSHRYRSQAELKAN